jgi:hypothetical protein
MCLSDEDQDHRCHNVWHLPRSIWVQREVTGTHFTLKLANSGMTSVGRARFKSPLAHQYDPRVDLGLYGIRGRFRGPIVAPLWHRFSSEALAWHGLNSTDAPTVA